MLKPVAAALIAAGIVLATPALSADSSAKAAHNAEKDRIAVQFKADKERCGPLSGNAKDICMAEAKGSEKAAKADADARFKGTVGAYTDALIARADADYDVAKEKCDDLAGNAKDVCVKEAKAAHTKAKVDAKTNRKVADARKEAADDKREANYAVAKERCDTFAGEAKSQCMKDAKARFGKT